MEATPVSEPAQEVTTEPVMETTPEPVPETVPETTPVDEKETTPESTEPINPVDMVNDKEDDLDKLLDTLATTMPKDITGNLEDTSKMELFADLAEKKKEKPEEKEPVKTQIVKKIITKPDGTKKVVMVRRVVSANGEPVKPTDGTKQVRRIVKKVGQPGSAEDNKVIVKKVVKQTPESEK